MKLTFFSTQTYDKTFFEEHNKSFGFAKIQMYDKNWYVSK